MLPLVPLLAVSIGLAILLCVSHVIMIFKVVHGRRLRRATAGSSKASSPASSELLSSNVNLVERLVPRFNVEQSYAEIYRGRWRETDVCVKIFDHTMSYSLLKEKTLFELQLFKHENIVQFYFADVIPGVGEILVFRYYDQGDLEQFLRRASMTDGISFSTGVKMSLSLLKGLDFLHSSFRTHSSVKPGIIHGDLSPKNILLDDHMRCVLTDFGNSVTTNKMGFVEEPINFGTRRYIAPEVLNGTLERSYQNLCRCEIYSVSLIIWEIMICVIGLGNSNLKPPVYSDVTMTPTHLDVRPAIPTTWSIYFPDGVELLQKAWSGESRVRPSSVELIKSFHILESFAEAQ